MTEMIVCGLSMEMNMAEEMGHIGKCIGCLYAEKWDSSSLFCLKKGRRVKERENCKDWLVDHR
jgi:hypothetical protein